MVSIGTTSYLCINNTINLQLRQVFFVAFGVQMVLSSTDKAVCVYKKDLQGEVIKQIFFIDKQMGLW